MRELQLARREIMPFSSIAGIVTRTTMARVFDPLPERPAEFMRYSAPDPDGLERDIERMRARLEKAIRDNDSLATVDHAADLGTMLTTARREAEAVQLLQSHGALAEAHVGREPSAWYWNALATALQYTGRRAEAEHYFAKSAGLSRLADWPRILAMTLHHWGRSLAEQRRFAEAEDCFSEALAIRIRIGEPRQERSRQALRALVELRRSPAGTEGVLVNPEIDFRPLRESDLAILHEWMLRPHVMEWWGGAAACGTVEETRSKYAPRLADDSHVRPYIALLSGEPIGFIQSYVAVRCGDGWWPDETDPGVRGIDQFLADGRRFGQGLGTQMVSAFVQRLFEDPEVTRVQTDPSPDNARAIRCYEKAGFRASREVVTPAGRALLMLIDRPLA